jgi:pimeloyl-ACP methyl ester carboxylesterase
VLGKPLAIPARIVTRIAYGNVKGITRLVGKTIDLVLSGIAPLLGESTPGPEREAVVAALNGVLGDWLVETKSPLAVEMHLRREGEGARVVVLVHGSSMCAHQWNWNGHDHGEALGRDDGWSRAYVSYNSGMPIAENGRLLADLLDALADVDEIAIVAHSMGGLVARMACHTAQVENRAWLAKLTTLVTLGSPHQGAPLERGGNIVTELLPISSYSAPLARLAKLRSVGITDMRHGVDVPLPEGVACWAVAAGKDRLVPVKSAHGPFPAENCSIVPDASHLDLLSSPIAYETIRRALTTTH